MRDTDRDLDSVENLDWDRIRTKFMENTDPGGAHPVDDDILPVYLEVRESLFCAMKEVLFELKLKKSSIISQDGVIFISGYTLGRAWRNLDKKGPHGREKQMIEDFIRHNRESFSSDAICWQEDIPKEVMQDFMCFKLKIETFLYACPQLLTGFYTALSLESVD